MLGVSFGDRTMKSLVDIVALVVHVLVKAMYSISHSWSFAYETSQGKLTTWYTFDCPGVLRAKKISVALPVSAIRVSHSHSFLALPLSL